MKVVHKFVLGPFADQKIVVPENSVPLCVQNQKESIVLYMLVDPSRPRVERNVRVIGTGWNEANVRTYGYVGTVQQALGNLVWHVFIDACPMSQMPTVKW